MYLYGIYLICIYIKTGSQNLNNLKKRVLLITAFAFSLLFMLSCRTGTPFRACRTKTEDYFGDVAYSSKLNSFNFPESKIWRSSDSVTSELVDIRISNLEYLKFNQNVNSLTHSAYETQITVLYLDKLLFNEKRILEDNIKGVSRFAVSGKLFRHEFYQKKDGNYLLLDEISGDASMITTNALDLIANRILFSGGVNNSIVIIGNADFEGNNSGRKSDILQKRIKRYIRLNG